MLRFLRALAAASIAATACMGPGAAAPSPSPKAELVLGLAPARTSPAQVAAAEQLAGQLSGLLKLPVVVRAEPTLGALDAGLASGAADLAWSDSLEYLALRQRHPYDPVLRGARCYPTYTPNPPAADCKPEPGTPAIIVCSAAAAIPELSDGGDWSVLRGKRFAFEDPASLTGYVWPRYFLSRNHVDPDHDVSKGPPTPSDAAVALSIYNGLVDCGTVAGDGRSAAVSIAPDIFDRTKVVFVAPANVPGDVVYLSTRLDRALAKRARTALERLGVLPAAAPAIQQLSGAPAMLSATAKDFDLLRAAVLAENPKLIEPVVPPSPSPSVSRRPSASPTRR